jgi:hypothetical protein
MIGRVKDGYCHIREVRKPERLGRGGRQIDDAIPYERSSIIDSDRYFTAVITILQLGKRVEW